MLIPHNCMAISIGDSNVSFVPLPTFGYSVELRLAVDIKKFHQNVSGFDRGIAFDQRRCSFRIMLSENELRQLKNVIDKERCSKNNRFILILQEGCGFFPAGPDKGDSGEFEFSFLENVNFSAMTIDPYGFFYVDFRILIHKAQKTLNFEVVPSETDVEGSFSFGSVNGLRDPLIRPIQDFGSRRQVTLGGEALTTWTPTDEFRSDLIIRTTTGKMAKLASYLQTIRGETFTVTPGRKYWMWGGQGKEFGEEKVKLLDANFIMTHTDFDLWTVPVQLWLEVELQEPAPIPKYTLSIVNNIEKGIVRINGVESYSSEHYPGDIISVSVEPKDSFAFDLWGGYSSSKDSNILVIMGTNDTELITKYKGDTGIILLINMPGWGYVSKSPSSPYDESDFFEAENLVTFEDADDEIALYLISNYGYRALGWYTEDGQLINASTYWRVRPFELPPRMVARFEAAT